jgi:phosphoglycolate phosphatase
MAEWRGPMREQVIEVVVLDLGGTTVTDPGVVEAAAREAAAGMFDARTFRAYRGGSKLDMLAALVGRDEAPAALEVFEAELLTAIEAGALEPLPHAETALRRFVDLGVRTCLSTGFSPPVRTALLTSLGWEHLVDLTLSPEGHLRGRPWPDLILESAIRLRATDMALVAAVGDTANDVTAARRAHAGIAAAVLTGAHDRATLEAAAPTHVLDHIGEFADLVADLVTAGSPEPD